MTEIAFWILAINCIILAILISVSYIKFSNERTHWVDMYYHTMKYAIKHLDPSELRELEEQLKEIK